MEEDFQYSVLTFCLLVLGLTLLSPLLAASLALGSLLSEGGRLPLLLLGLELLFVLTLETFSSNYSHYFTFWAFCWASSLVRLS